MNSGGHSVRRNRNRGVSSNGNVSSSMSSNNQRPLNRSSSTRTNIQNNYPNSVRSGDSMHSRNSTTFNTNGIVNNNHISEVWNGVYKNKRLVHSMTSLIGCLIEVQLNDGKRYEGILKTFSSDFKMALSAAAPVVEDPDPENSNSLNLGNNIGNLLAALEKKEEVVETLLIDCDKLVTFRATGVDLDYATKKMQTDSEIAGRESFNSLGGRELVPWDDGDKNDTCLERLDVSDNSHGWGTEEMFKYNELKYSITTTYNNNEYTIPLEQRDDDKYRQLEAQAARLAQEIEQDPTRTQRYAKEDDVDEETQFSAVVREPTLNTSSSSSSSSHHHHPHSNNQNNHLKNDLNHSERRGNAEQSNFRTQNPRQSRSNRLNQNNINNNNHNRDRERNSNTGGPNEPNWRESNNTYNSTNKNSTSNNNSRFINQNQQQQQQQTTYNKTSNAVGNYNQNVKYNPSNVAITSQQSHIARDSSSSTSSSSTGGQQVRSSYSAVSARNVNVNDSSTPASNIPENEVKNFPSNSRNIHLNKQEHTQQHYGSTAETDVAYNRKAATSSQRDNYTSKPRTYNRAVSEHHHHHQQQQQQQECLNKQHTASSNNKPSEHDVKQQATNLGSLNAEPKQTTKPEQSSVSVSSNKVSNKPSEDKTNQQASKQQRITSPKSTELDHRKPPEPSHHHPPVNQQQQVSETTTTKDKIPLKPVIEPEIKRKDVPSMGTPPTTIASMSSASASSETSISNEMAIASAAPSTTLDSSSSPAEEIVKSSSLNPNAKSFMPRHPPGNNAILQPAQQIATNTYSHHPATYQHHTVSTTPPSLPSAPMAANVPFIPYSNAIPTGPHLTGHPGAGALPPPHLNPQAPTYRYTINAPNGLSFHPQSYPHLLPQLVPQYIVAHSAAIPPSFAIPNAGMPTGANSTSNAGVVQAQQTVVGPQIQNSHHLMSNQPPNGPQSLQNTSQQSQPQNSSSQLPNRGQYGGRNMNNKGGGPATQQNSNLQSQQQFARQQQQHHDFSQPNQVANVTGQPIMATNPMLVYSSTGHHHGQPPQVMHGGVPGQPPQATPQGLPHQIGVHHHQGGPTHHNQAMPYITYSGLHHPGAGGAPRPILQHPNANHFAIPGGVYHPENPIPLYLGEVPTSLVATAPHQQMTVMPQHAASNIVPPSSVAGGPNNNVPPTAAPSPAVVVSSSNSPQGAMVAPQSQPPPPSQGF